MTHYSANQNLEGSLLTSLSNQSAGLSLQAVLHHIVSAKKSITHQQTVKRGHHIGKAISILSGLRSNLNEEKNQEIDENLDKFYEHIQHILLKANIDNDIELIQQAETLLSQDHEPIKKTQTKRR